MENKKLLLNSSAAVIQVLLVGVVYFVLYRYLLDILGIELLGVWSLIIASTSVALLANFGISTSIIKFVATYYARNDIESLKKLLFTAGVFILSTYSVISIIIYFFAPFILHHFVDIQYINIALEILPWSILSLLVNAVGGVFSSGLDGIQKNHLRSFLISISSIVLLICSFLLTKPLGLLGLVYSQIFQALLVLLGSIYFLNKNIKGIFSFHWNWSKPLFKEIFSYGLKMQLLSVMQISFEPITKFLMSKYGGLAFVGYYEMANRLVTQLRSVIVNANQVMIPVVAEAKEVNASNLITIYKKTFSWVFFITLLFLSGLISIAPIIGYLWIGHWVPFFNFVVVISCAATLINLVTNPAYFNFMGEGNLNPLIYSYLIIFILNPILGFFLGEHLLANGIVIAWNISFSLGSIAVTYLYHKQNKTTIQELLNKNDILLFVSAVFFSSVTFIISSLFILKKLSVFWISISIFAFLMFCLAFLKHPKFVLVYQFIKNKISKK